MAIERQNYLRLRNGFLPGSLQIRCGLSNAGCDLSGRSYRPLSVSRFVGCLPRGQPPRLWLLIISGRKPSSLLAADPFCRFLFLARPRCVCAQPLLVALLFLSQMPEPQRSAPRQLRPKLDLWHSIVCSPRHSCTVCFHLRPSRRCIRSAGCSARFRMCARIRIHIRMHKHMQ